MIRDLWASSSWPGLHVIWLIGCLVGLAVCAVVGWFYLNKLRSEIDDAQSRVKLFGHELRRLGRRIADVEQAPQGALLPLVESLEPGEKTSVTQLVRGLVVSAEEAADEAQTRVQDHRTRVVLHRPRTASRG